MSPLVSEKLALPPEAQDAWNRLNQRQQAFCLAYFECGNGAEAYRKAGYEAAAFNAAAAASWRLLNHPDIRTVIQAMLELYRLTPETAARKLHEALEATDTKFFTHEGQVLSEREIIDWRTRMIALDMLHKILGKYKMSAPPDGYSGPLIYLPKGFEPGSLAPVEMGASPALADGHGNGSIQP